MPALWAAGIGAVIGGGLSYAGANNSNNATAAATSKGRIWQEAMRATQYQTTVQDLVAAGLNPMLAVANGPNGTPGTNVNQFSNEMDGVGSAVSNATAAYQAKKQGEVADATVNKANSEAAVAQAMVPKIQADTIGSTNSAAYTAANTKLVDVTVQKVLSETKNIKDDNERIHATIAKLRGETENLPFTQEQIKLATDLIGVQIKGGGISNFQKSLDTPRLQNESNMHSGSGGAIIPYLPFNIGKPLSGAKEAWDNLTDYVREKRSSSGFDSRR